MKNYKITNMSKNGKKLLNLGKYILVGSLVVSSITACVKDDEVDTTLSTSDYSMEQTVETSAIPDSHYGEETSATVDAEHYMDENGNIIFPTDHAITPEGVNTDETIVFPTDHAITPEGVNTDETIVFPTDHPLDKIVNETTAQHYINQNGNVDFPTEHALTSGDDAQHYMDENETVVFPTEHGIGYPTEHGIGYPTEHGIGYPTEHGIGFPTEHGIGFPTEHALTSGDGAQHYMDENGNLINSGDDAQHYMDENGNGLRKSL